MGWPPSVIATPRGSAWLVAVTDFPNAQVTASAESPPYVRPASVTEGAEQVCSENGQLLPFWVSCACVPASASATSACALAS